MTSWGEYTRQKILERVETALGIPERCTGRVDTESDVKLSQDIGVSWKILTTSDTPATIFSVRIPCCLL